MGTSPFGYLLCFGALVFDAKAFSSVGHSVLVGRNEQCGAFHHLKPRGSNPPAFVATPRQVRSYPPVVGVKDRNGREINTIRRRIVASSSPLLMTKKSGDDGKKDDGKKGNKKDGPYGDFDYTAQPLEFIDYSDPDYKIDMGIIEGEEQYTAQGAILDDDEAIEEMREERRRKNDEFQFETYFKEAWKEGAEYWGEWTTYGTTTFLDGFDTDEDSVAARGGFPGIVKAKNSRKVISMAKKVVVDPDAAYGGDREVIRHLEYEITNEALEPTLRASRDIDTDSGFGRHDYDDDEGDEESLNTGDGSVGSDSKEAEGTPGTRAQVEERYWPANMTWFDFRGEQGNMCVGNAYSICDAVRLFEGEGGEGQDHDGPFSEYRMEVGIHGEDLRMRVKLEYKVKGTDDLVDTTPPPLHLSTMTICRERREAWPDDRRDVALFGAAGARGGLYDPPPVGTDDQAERYMMIDLEGGATVLFPHMIDQHHASPTAATTTRSIGWVHSLDWTPGTIRFQVDRKFHGGAKMKGLRTLELAEVQALESETWRPKKGPENMSQF